MGQKDAAARAVRDLTGVSGVSNNITVQPHVKSIDVRDTIEAAFKRSAEIDARRINVTAADGKVILTGNGRSWAERQQAERAAWAAPGVTQVDDPQNRRRGTAGAKEPMTKQVRTLHHTLERPLSAARCDLHAAVSTRPH